MSTAAKIKLRKELQLIARFADGYRRRCATMIDQLNHPSPNAPNSDLQCVRMCVEAVDMMLATQAQIAKALAEAEEIPPVRHAA